jgi:hypothetical protein
MVEILITITVAFAAGGAVRWLLRSALARAAHRFRNSNAAPEGAKIEAIERIRHSLRGAELLPLPEEIVEGPLTPAEAEHSEMYGSMLAGCRQFCCLHPQIRQSLIGEFDERTRTDLGAIPHNSKPFATDWLLSLLGTPLIGLIRLDDPTASFARPTRTSGPRFGKRGIPFGNKPGHDYAVVDLDSSLDRKEVA